MKGITAKVTQCLWVLFISSLIIGCASRQKETISSDPSTGGQLQHAGEGICLDAQSGRMWQVNRSRSFTSPREAEKYAESLELGGYNDWRLPTRQELFLLYSQFYWKKNGDCSMNHTGDYWAVTENGEPTPGHWETYYLCGPEHKYVESIAARGSVRAVRP